MTVQELNSIIDGKAYLKYNGNLFEYLETEQMYEVETGEVWQERDYFQALSDGHEVDFLPETILKCSEHFQIVFKEAQDNV